MTLMWFLLVDPKLQTGHGQLNLDKHATIDCKIRINEIVFALAYLITVLKYKNNNNQLAFAN